MHFHKFNYVRNTHKDTESDSSLSSPPRLAFSLCSPPSQLWTKRITSPAFLKCQLNPLPTLNFSFFLSLLPIFLIILSIMISKIQFHKKSVLFPLYS